MWRAFCNQKNAGLSIAAQSIAGCRRRCGRPSVPTRAVDDYFCPDWVGTPALCLNPSIAGCGLNFPAAILSHPLRRLWRQELRNSTAPGAPPASPAELRAAFRQRGQRRTVMQQFAANPGREREKKGWLCITVAVALITCHFRSHLFTPTTYFSSKPGQQLRELRTGAMEGLAATV